MKWDLPTLVAVASVLSAKFLVASAVESVDASASSPPVKTWLRSSWPAPDLLIEIIETVSLEDPSLYFAAFDAITNTKAITDGDDSYSAASFPSHRSIYDSAVTRLTLAGIFAEPGSRFSFDASLSLHAATPAIEAFYQYFDAVTAHEHGADAGCTSWVSWDNERRTCDVDVLSGLVAAAGTSGEAAQNESQLLPFDHIHPSPHSRLRRPPHTAILYVSLSNTDYRVLHDVLYAASSAIDSDVQYVIRYIPPKVASSQRNYLTGYGVALDLKKTDYLALDDRKTSSGTPEVVASNDDGDTSVIVRSDAHLVQGIIQSLPEPTDSTQYASPLDSNETLSLAAKASYMIANSSTPLEMLLQVSQNFPKYANAIARRVPEPEEEFLNEISGTRMSLPAGFSGLWVNGQMLNEADVDILSLMKLLRAERKRMLSLHELGLSPVQAVDVISWSPPRTGPGSGSGAETVLEGYFDASDRIEGGEVIVWFNNLETDTRYSKWPSSLTGLYQGGMMGQFPSIRRNLNNIIVVLDLSLPSSLAFVASPIPTIIGRNLPFRWGIVANAETESSQKMARLFYFAIRRYGRKKVVNLFKQLADLNRVSVDLSKARTLFEAIEAEHHAEHVSDPNDLPVPWAAVVNSAAEESVTRAAAYATRLSATKASFASGHAFINGKHFDFTEDFLRYVQSETVAQNQYIVEQLYSGKLQDDAALDMSVYFYDLPTTVSRRNKFVYPSSKAGSLKVFDMPALFDEVGLDRGDLEYLYPQSDEAVPVTIWAIGDMDDPAYGDLLYQTVLAINSTTSFRFAYLHSYASDGDASAVSTQTSAATSLYALVAQKALSSATPDDLLSVLERLYPNLRGSTREYEDKQAVLSEGSSLHTILNSILDIDSAKYAQYIAASTLLRKAIGFGPGEMGLIVNGRVVGPFGSGDFTAADFESLCAYEMQRRVTPVVEALKETYPGLEDLKRVAHSELVAMVSSVVASAFVPDPVEQGLRSAPPMKRDRPYVDFPGNHSSFEIGDLDSAIIQIGVILDPLSVTAQKWSSILTWLSKADFVHTYVLLNPQPSEQVPLKRFYRYSLPGQLAFDHDGDYADVAVQFHGLPAEPIYTLGMDVPKSWMVRPHESLYDLDNIHLATLSPSEKTRGVEAIFDLDFLVIEGHAREANNAPPRGVQLELTSVGGNTTEPIADTLVMANLGYLQFRAKPGVFNLGIRPGRGREVFEMESVGNQGWDSPSIREAGDVVTLTSFEGLTLYPRLKRREGMEAADVLERSDSGPGVEQVLKKGYDWMKSYFGNSDGTGAEVSTKVQADINIFTVASGLLYERFVGIMILSVLKNTKSSVKFWFIENFLSPAFLEFIPHMAEAYGFQYELVTFKWPSWLRAQTEKQRIIWGYKILFLDVLFPMDLKKVIFVDADQVVRADLQELVDLDLQGAPYGYTPMGDDNTDMEGFRFWKTGYWKDFLRGKPYHISALYVIDLIRFRELAAGDRLRGQYQGLSADPNSLSNLDQDLPNNLQHDVPIFSLPEDWLWCETWCSKDRFHRAKTIDLCQNPLTKEPKLVRARQIPEWETYDSEIARFAQSLVQEGKIKASAIAASVNDLASIGTKDEKKADTDGEGAEETESETKGGKHDAGDL